MKLRYAAVRAVGRLTELRRLPQLALVLAEVLHDEGRKVRNREEPLTRGVNREAAEVARDPASTELLGDDGGGTRSDEAVEHEVTGLGRRPDDPSRRTRLLRRIADHLGSREHLQVVPYGLERHAFGLVQELLVLRDVVLGHDDHVRGERFVDLALTPSPILSRGGRRTASPKQTR